MGPRNNKQYKGMGFKYDTLYTVQSDTSRHSVTQPIIQVITITFDLRLDIPHYNDDTIP